MAVTFKCPDTYKINVIISVVTTQMKVMKWMEPYAFHACNSLSMRVKLISNSNKQPSSLLSNKLCLYNEPKTYLNHAILNKKLVEIMKTKSTLLPRLTTITKAFNNEGNDILK